MVLYLIVYASRGLWEKCECNGGNDGYRLVAKRTQASLLVALGKCRRAKIRQKIGITIIEKYPDLKSWMSACERRGRLCRNLFGLNDGKTVVVGVEEISASFF